MSSCTAEQENAESKDPIIRKSEVLTTDKVLGTDFKIEFLGTHTSQKSVSEMQGIGKVEMVSLMSDGLMFTYNDLPSDIFKTDEEVNQFYEGKIAFILMDLGVNPEQTDIKVEIIQVSIDNSDYKGKEFAVSAPDGKEVLVGRTFFDDNTAYFLMAFSTGDDSNPREFVNSFELLK
jgi:hypothetical protein